jgi:hypothetical protein
MGYWYQEAKDCPHFQGTRPHPNESPEGPVETLPVLVDSAGITAVFDAGGRCG